MVEPVSFVPCSHCFPAKANLHTVGWSFSIGVAHYLDSAYSGNTGVTALTMTEASPSTTTALPCIAKVVPMPASCEPETNVSSVSCSSSTLQEESDLRGLPAAAGIKASLIAIHRIRPDKSDAERSTTSPSESESQIVGS